MKNIQINSATRCTFLFVDRKNNEVIMDDPFVIEGHFELLNICNDN